MIKFPNGSKVRVTSGPAGPFKIGDVYTVTHTHTTPHGHYCYLTNSKGDVEVLPEHTLEAYIPGPALVSTPEPKVKEAMEPPSTINIPKLPKGYVIVGPISVTVDPDGRTSLRFDVSYGKGLEADI